ncbi:MAG: copper homeostasis protein CutC, partial [Gemmatimonadota bacterium]
MTILVEVCVDGIGSAQAAVTGGAGRMELCADRASGGLTPSPGMVEAIRQISDKPLAILIRPRAGDFLYDNAEFGVMRRDVTWSRELGAEAVVIGVARDDGTIDLERTAELAALARPMDVVYHR